ncbi:vomeronasal type-2 receptor 116-like isoform X2 [Cricetulus griseus]|uniref:Vomeronasal type-2 receptor 116-like isoform X2 n=1 Tax=Cricetulus griseus TaxID=10029 RepID=A0A9J7KCT7_CRIGR|nr:vomeronasal type-2 receptor 116-like isoform X2 [Cricetulus griseus]
MLILIFFFLLLNIPRLISSSIHPSCFWKMKHDEDEHGFLKIGCVFFPTIVQGPVEKEYFNDILNVPLPPENYKFALVLAFALDEVNRNPDLLPNKSLVFNFTENNCFRVSQLYSLYQNLEQDPEITPNYACKKIPCLMMITGPYWETSVMFRTYMEFYINQQIIQLTYGPSHPMLNDREKFPYLYQMAPKDTSLALAMVSVILHFRWNWIGLVISDNDQGKEFLSYLRRELENNTICLAFVNMIPINTQLYMSRAEAYYNQIDTSSTNVVIIYGDTDSTLSVSFQMWKSRGLQRIWVITSQWDVTISKREFIHDSSHMTLVFAQYHGEISGFKNFVQRMNPVEYTDDYLARLEWMNFNCEVSMSNCNTLKNCSLNDAMEWVLVRTSDMDFSDDSYDIYNAVYALAHTLHEMDLQQVDTQPMNNGKGKYSSCWKMNTVLKKTQFTNPVGDTVNMNQKGKLQKAYDIFHIWSLPPHGVTFKVKIGTYSPYFQHGPQIHVYEDMLEWSTGDRQVGLTQLYSLASNGLDIFTFRYTYRYSMPSANQDTIAF